MRKLAKAFSDEVVKRGLSVSVKELFFKMPGLEQMPHFVYAYNKYAVCRETVLWAVQIVEEQCEITDQDVLNRGWFGFCPDGFFNVSYFQERYWRSLLAIKTGKIGGEPFTQDELSLGRILCKEALAMWVPVLKQSCLYDRVCVSASQPISKEASDEDRELVPVAKKIIAQASRDALLLLGFREKYDCYFQELAELQGVVFPPGH